MLSPQGKVKSMRTRAMHWEAAVNKAPFMHSLSSANLASRAGRRADSREQGNSGGLTEPN